VRVLELARELGLLRVGTVAVDGTKVWANAAKRATLSATQVEEQLGFLHEQAAPGRPPRRKSRRRQVPGQLRQRMSERLQSAEGVRLYRLRRTSVEPVFGMIKSVLGFRRFGLRGLDKVNLEWQLVSAALNCRRLATRRRRQLRQ
jgi:Transposase DDE domain